MTSIIAKNTYLIEVLGEIPNTSFALYKNDEYLEDLFLGNTHLYLHNMLEVGNHYQLKHQEQSFDINLSELVDLPNFDDKYYYDEKLGAIVENDVTTFRIFAPLAYEAYVIVLENNNRYVEKMSHHSYGVYEITINSNLHGKSYLYQLHQNGEVVEVLDPYCYATSLNKRESVVVDLNKIIKHNTREFLPVFTNNTEAIIYETSVRDFTSFNKGEIVAKGTYKGFVEKNKKYQGHPIGLDYLKYLGITHVQLLPINAFKGVDETKIAQEYNWGYNPFLYLSLEGSMSLHPSDPLERIEEFQSLVSELHKSGIRVNLDVVFNHIYDYEHSVFEKVVPNYYFRRRDGKMSNGSYCGNDLDTSRKMVRKHILDTLEFFVDFYDIDGFRFDLMGIIDLDTTKEIARKLKAKKPDIMLYGEGWDMPTFLDYEKKSITEHANDLADFAFFNDFYRDTLKGGTFNKYERGYLIDNIYLKNAFEIAFKGYYRKLEVFNSAKQSINYLECHDNLTLFDKISYCIESNNEEEILPILKLCNAVLILSFGVPFIHMGQEVGLTKHKEDNTYNKGDNYNQFDYNVLAKRFDLVSFMRDLIMLRKSYSCFQEYDYRSIEKMISFEEFDAHALKINYQLANNKLMSIFINTSTKENVYYNFKKTQRVIFNEAGLVKSDWFVDSLILSPTNLVVVINK